MFTLKKRGCVLLIMAIFTGFTLTSCKEKEPIKPSPNGNGTEESSDTRYDERLSEGIYQPAYRIDKLYHGDAIYQTWEWGTSKLASVEDVEADCHYEFGYSGDQMSSVNVSYADGTTESLTFGYNGLLTRIEIADGTMTRVVMGISHNANDKITNISLDYSDDYIFEMARGQLMSKRAISHVLSRSAVNAMMELGRMMDGQCETKKGLKGGEKYTVTNKHFSLIYTWNGDNLASEELTGNFSAMADINDVANIFNLGALAGMASYFADGDYPVSYTVNSHTTYTYDGKTNPTLYYWGKGISAYNLSANNVLTASTTGAAEMAVTVSLPDSLNSMIRTAIISMWGGSTEHTYTREKDLSANESHTYTYNVNNYVKTDVCNGVTTRYEYK